jgi:hypothetical protein
VSIVAAVILRKTMFFRGIINANHVVDIDMISSNLTTYPYSCTEVFESGEPCNATAYACTPNGTQYAVCTTLQYFGYKPASNATWLTVEPQSTQILQTTKTPEQMQQEAPKKQIA